MNKVLYFFVAAVCLLSSCGGGSKPVSDGSSAGSKGKAFISFAKLEHNFGQIAEGETVSCIFGFTNTGTSDLVVNETITSCGCTVSKFDSKPIQPGDSGMVEVSFDTSGREGTQTKIITVRSNAETPAVMLKISAEVVKTNK